MKNSELKKLIDLMDTELSAPKKMLRSTLKQMGENGELTPDVVISLIEHTRVDERKRMNNLF